MIRVVQVLAVAVLLLSAPVAPASAGLFAFDQASRIRTFADEGTTVKNMKTNFGFLWYPRFPQGAPGGYFLSFTCDRLQSKGGKATISDLTLTGVDSGETLEIGKKSKKLQDGSTGRVAISRADLSSLAGESSVLVTGKVVLKKNLQTGVCNIFLTEFGG